MFLHRIHGAISLEALTLAMLSSRATLDRQGKRPNVAPRWRTLSDSAQLNGLCGFFQVWTDVLAASTSWCHNNLSTLEVRRPVLLDTEKVGTGDEHDHHQSGSWSERAVPHVLSYRNRGVWRTMIKPQRRRSREALPRADMASTERAGARSLEAKHPGWRGFPRVSQNGR